MKCIKCGAELVEGAAFCHLCGKKQTEERKHRKRANGTGSIQKLPGNRQKPWQAKKGGIHIGAFSTRTEAQKALERLTDTNINEVFNLTFADIYERWKPEHARTVSKHSMDNYRCAFRDCTELHDRVFRGLRTSAFQAVIIRMEQEGKSKSTCEKMLQLFGQLSDWAIREGIQTVNYSKFCTIEAEQKSTGRVLPPEAIRKLQASTAPAARVALVLLATGCRGNELFNVPLSDCHDGYFIGGSKTAAGLGRVIAVAPVGLEAYRQMMGEAKSAGGTKLIDGYSRNRVYENYAKRDFAQLMDDLELEDFTPYDLRHTFATQTQRAGVDAQIRRRQLGHADLKTTDKYYTHLEADDILKAMKDFDIFSG